jgi:hypothetical protein
LFKEHLECLKGFTVSEMNSEMEQARRSVKVENEELKAIC